MRVLVCGSRTFKNADTVDATLFGWSALRGDDPEYVIIEGGAKGADKHAAAWAEVYAVEHLPFPADWERHGKAAGFIRNQQMLEQGKPDLVLAFVDKPLHESRGTADMVRRAEDAGVRVIVIEELAA